MSFEIKYNDQPTPHGMHTHTYYEMLYVLSGSTTITVRNRAYECGPGSLIFLNPFDEHASHPLELPYKRYYLLIPLNELKAFHNNVLLLSVFRFHGEQFPYVVQVGEQKARFDFYFSIFAFKFYCRFCFNLYIGTGIYESFDEKNKESRSGLNMKETNDDC